MTSKPAYYSFVTTMVISAKTEIVWQKLIDFAGWKKWWKGVRKITIIHPEFPQIFEAQIGTFFYALTFRATIQTMTEHKEITFLAEKDMVGSGQFLLNPTNNGTQISFYWNVHTAKPWMNTTAPILRPLFEMSHNMVMRQFARGLAKELDAVLMEYHSQTLHAEFGEARDKLN